jgi:hypothetical protein
MTNEKQIEQNYIKLCKDLERSPIAETFFILHHIAAIQALLQVSLGVENDKTGGI